MKKPKYFKITKKMKKDRDIRRRKGLEDAIDNLRKIGESRPVSR